MRSRAWLTSVHVGAILSLAAALVVPMGGRAEAQPSLPPPQGAALEARLTREAQGPVRISYHAQTGKVRFLGTDPGHPIARPAGLPTKALPEDSARAFLSTYGSLFGLADQAQELRAVRSQAADRDRSVVRFQQVYRGIPVLGGELVVQMDSSKNIVAVSGEALPDLQLDVEPSVSPASAQEAARQSVAKGYDLEPGDLVLTSPELWIYNPVLLKLGWNRSFLVWRMEVASPLRLTMRELVLVDARSGIVALQFNQVDTARYRKIYDNQNVVSKGLPGGEPLNVPSRVEGGAATGITDIDDAYDYLGFTYDFYSTYHSRDSLDNAGMPLVATVRYCEPGYACPFANAFWNGQQMAFGQGYASADDVVGHELSHGVTEHESRLFYYYQSGAINESFSDLWGEFIDLTYTNGRDDDSPGVRWLMGEDIPGGAIRSMSNPPAYGDPDRVGSANYTCGTSDGGGVHTNSGVNNKAAYLLTDGGTFNGYTVTGLGIAKAAKIYYEAQTNLLASAADYQDLYDNLYQSCLNLVGTGGITLADCQEVQDATNATQMNQVACSASEAPICAAGQYPLHLFFDNLENPASGRWTSAATTGNNEWAYPQNPNGVGWLDATYATSGVYNFYGYDQAATADYHIRMTSDVTLPAGSFLHFRHSYDFEVFFGTRYDGGVVEYSTNGGTSWNDAGGLFTHNGYNGAIAGGTSNPLAGRNAFVAESAGYRSSRLDLSTLAGQNVRFRFRIGTDSTGNDYGWFIDDVRVYTCAAAATWEGDVSSSWSTPGNWSTGAVPACGSNAIIPTVPVGGRWPTVDAAAEVNNLVVQTGAQLNMAANTLGVCGDWEVQGTGLFNGTGGTVLFRGAGDQTIEMASGANGQFFHLQIGNGSTTQMVWAKSDLDVNGNLSIMSGAFFHGDAFTHTVAGSWSAQGAFVPGSSTVVFDGGVAQTASGGSYTVVGENFKSEYVPQAIPDNGCGSANYLNSTLSVGGLAATIQDVNVTIGRITHPRDDNLDIYVRHPDSTQVELSTDNGGNGDNYDTTVLDDEANIAIAGLGATYAPFSGRFRPESSLSALDGKDRRGTWTLRVCDDAINNTGTLTFWSLSLSYTSSGARFYNLTVAADSSVSLSSDALVERDLVVEAGGLLDIGTRTLAVNGTVTNDGSLRQTRSAPAGTTTSFLNISTNKYYGVDILPAANMGSTTVTVGGNQTCSGFLNAVLRCYEIAPGSAVSSAVTFYYRDAEENGQDAANAYHWNGSSWDGLASTRDRSGVENNWVQATGVTSYSPFGLGNSDPTAVRLASFAAFPASRGIRLAWETWSEVDSVGFHLYRSLSRSVLGSRLNETMIPAQAPGQGQGAVYEYLDTTAEPGVTYYYTLVDVDLSGHETPHGPVEAVLWRAYLPLVTW